MPKPVCVPETVWLTAETKAMEEGIHFYGKTFHFWEVDKRHKFPLGTSLSQTKLRLPKLMTNFTREHQIKRLEGVDTQQAVDGIDLEKSRNWRKDIEEPEISGGIHFDFIISWAEVDETSQGRVYKLTLLESGDG
jgi:hypothetical protein